MKQIKTFGQATQKLMKLIESVRGNEYADRVAIRSALNGWNWYNDNSNTCFHIGNMPSIEFSGQFKTIKVGKNLMVREIELDYLNEKNESITIKMTMKSKNPTIVRIIKRD